LYDRIKGFIENSVTPIGYRRISKIFNDEGLKTPRGTSFTNSKVHSMYKKGLIREERMNREDIVEVSPVTIELIIHPILGRLRRSPYEKSLKKSFLAIKILLDQMLLAEKWIKTIIILGEHKETSAF